MPPVCIICPVLYQQMNCLHQIVGNIFSTSFDIGVDENQFHAEMSIAYHLWVSLDLLQNNLVNSVSEKGI